MSEITLPGSATAPARDRAASLRPPAAGAIGVLAGIGFSELAAGLLSAPSLLASVGSFLIDRQPAGAKDIAVSLFGTNDKVAFEIVVVLVAAGVGAVLGRLAAARGGWIATIGFGAFAVLGFLAALRGPDASPTTSMAVAAVAGIGGHEVFAYLFRGASSIAIGSSTMPNWSRRGFLVRAGALAAASGVAGIAGRRLLESARSAPQVATPIPGAETRVTLPAGASIETTGITPIVVPNGEFYRIDTALLVPNVDVTSWRLSVKGMVDHPITLTFDQLVQLPMIEQYVTIACVSNEVGGNLVGNAKWTGVRLRDVLAMAGVQAGATQLVGRSVDGWTAGMPTDWVMDPSREPMIAVKMNDEVLPRLHGFPARLIVPGLYGYVSATKWLSSLELTTLEAFNGYWVPLGWSKKAPILTQSRIDVPGFGLSVPRGRVPIAGVAWAPDRGISKVEVSIDGEWRDCQLCTPISKSTWVQWLYAWDTTAAAAGSHQIAVRATDGAGVVQTADRTPPAPDGARGYHTIIVDLK
jgi:DMSO/TMAO reductase YedYZ molybdopterin-dependent catalytic subunit